MPERISAQRQFDISTYSHAPRLYKAVHMYTNASQYDMGAALSQRIDSPEKGLWVSKVLS